MALVEPAPIASDARKALRDTILALMGITRTTQTAMAKAIPKMDQGSLSKRLKVNGPPFTEDHLIAIADYFGLPSPDVLYRTSEAIALIRSRCFSLVPLTGGPDQLVLPGIVLPEVLAVAI